MTSAQLPVATYVCMFRVEICIDCWDIANQIGYVNLSKAEIFFARFDVNNRLDPSCMHVAIIKIAAKQAKNYIRTFTLDKLTYTLI